MARVLKGSHSFTCTPCIHPLTEWTIPASVFPAEAGTHLPTQEGWAGLGGWLHTKISVRHRVLNPDIVTHLSANRARRRLTSRIETNTLPLSQTTRISQALKVALSTKNTHTKSESRDHIVEMYDSAIIALAQLYIYDLWPITSDLENFLSNAHSHDEYLWQVSLNSLHTVWRHWIRKKVLTLDERKNGKHNDAATYCWQKDNKRPMNKKYQALTSDGDVPLVHKVHIQTYIRRGWKILKVNLPHWTPESGKWTKISNIIYLGKNSSVHLSLKKLAFKVK